MIRVESSVRHAVVVLLAACALLSSQARADEDDDGAPEVSGPIRILVEVDAAKQGKIASIPEHTALVGYRVEQAGATPRDPSTGLPTGRRSYSPVILLKPEDPQGIKLTQAWATNETLRTVIFHFYARGPKGTFVEFETIELQNANVVSVKNSFTGGQGDLPAPQQELSFTFQKITWTNGGQTASDDFITAP